MTLDLKYSKHLSLTTLKGVKLYCLLIRVKTNVVLESITLHSANIFKANYVSITKHLMFE